MDNFPLNIMQHLQPLVESGKLQVPPPIFKDMEGEFVDFDLENKTITIRFPIKERYQNPVGYMQGGMIATAIDNTMGPLSYAIAAPSVTKKLEIEYFRPVPSSMSHITITAFVESQEERVLTLIAEVKRGDGTVLARGTATNIIMKQRAQTK